MFTFRDGKVAVKNSTETTDFTPGTPATLDTLVIQSTRTYLGRFTSLLKGTRLFTIKESYTPAEAKRANDQLDGLISSKEITSRKAGTYRRQIAQRVRIALKQSYTSQAAKRAKTEIMKLVEAGTIPAMSARAYRAHVTKRTLAA